MTSVSGSKRVIGIGNEFRGDDGVGPLLVRQLRQRKDFEKIEFLECSGDTTVLFEKWNPRDEVILVDVICSGGQAGSIYKFDALSAPLPSDLFPSVSTHVLDVSRSIELARSLGRLPKKLLVFGIEGKSFQTDSKLNLKVKKAMEKVTEEIRKEFVDYA